MDKKFAFIAAVKILSKMVVKAQNNAIFAKIVKTFCFKIVYRYHHLWHDYVFGKQTLTQLSKQYKISVSSVQRSLKKAHSVHIISSEKDVVLLIDATYWGRNFGVVVFKDARRKRILWRKFVRYETLADYTEVVEWLEENGFQIKGIVCDGLRGMFSLLSKYKVQNVPISSNKNSKTLFDFAT